MPAEESPTTRRTGERALCFTTDELFADAIRYLWRSQPFQPAGFKNSIIVPHEVAEDLLKRYKEPEEVEEATFIDISDLPHDEAVQAHMDRFRRFRNR